MERKLGIGILNAIPVFLNGYQPNTCLIKLFSVKMFNEKNLNSLSKENKKKPPIKIIKWRTLFCIEKLNFLSDGFFTRNTGVGSWASEKSFFVDWFFAVFANTISAIIQAFDSLVVDA